MKKPFLSLFLLSAFLAVRSQQFSLIKDINPGEGTSNICYLTKVDNTLFFAANDGTNGMELWKSDGTTGGTVLVKDINPGAASSSIGYLTLVNHQLFFVASNGTTGTELWKSDGTAAGTMMVKDIRTGSMSSSPSALVEMDGKLFFAADNGVNGMELWKSDGTAAGTVMVKDIRSTGGSYPQSLANVSGMLFFAADNGTTGMELWKSDGTAAGTVLVKDIWAGSDDGYPYELVGVGGTLFFAANNGSSGTELWKSDGTAAGTAIVKDIWSGTGESYPFMLRSINGLLFFSADNGTNGVELWKSDGTAAGTLLVKDVWPGEESGAVGNFSSLINRLIFTGNDGVSGYKTWQSDGSLAGTRIASDIADPGEGSMQELVETDSKIYASIQEEEMGRELWGINYSSVLPVEFLEFTGRLLNNDGMLNWKTANEVNVENYTIERSTNGVDYSAIGTVTAAGSTAVNVYAFTDRGVNTLGSAIIYYRLRQNDVYGQFTYSRIIVLALKASHTITLYPVPAGDDLNIMAVIVREEKLRYQVFDNSGRVVLQDTKKVSAGTNNFSIAVGKLAAGVYYLYLRGELIDTRLRFVKQ